MITAQGFQQSRRNDALLPAPPLALPLSLFFFPFFFFYLNSQYFL